MHPHPTALAIGAAGGSTFLGLTARQTPGAITFPAGTYAGCVAIVNVPVNDASVDVPTGLSGWALLGRMTTTNPGSGSQGTVVYWKQLTAGDIATPPTIGNTLTGGITCAVYANCTSVALLTASVESAATDSFLAISGSPTGARKGIVILASDRDNGTITGSATGFTYRGGGATGESQWSTYVWDDLENRYAGGSVTLNGFVATNKQMGMMLELR